jgi:hypothetical protein
MNYGQFNKDAKDPKVDRDRKQQKRKTVFKSGNDSFIKSLLEFMEKYPGHKSMRETLGLGGVRVDA